MLTEREARDELNHLRTQLALLEELKAKERQMRERASELAWLLLDEEDDP